MARKDIFGSVMGPTASTAEARDISGYTVRGASRSIMQSFEELSKSSIVELDANLIDSSFVSDRIDDSDEEFQELITRYAWGEIWTRPGLDVRTRRLLVIGTLVALGRFDELRLHVTAALGDGLPAEDIKEVLLQQAIYCGVPAANSAFEVFREVVEHLEG